MFDKVNELINQNWIYEILSMYGKFPSGGVVPLVSGGNAVANSIGIGIDDITLWLYYVTDVTPVNMVKEIHLKQFFSTVKNAGCIFHGPCDDLKNAGCIFY